VAAPVTKVDSPSKVDDAMAKVAAAPKVETVSKVETPKVEVVSKVAAAPPSPPALQPAEAQTAPLIDFENSSETHPTEAQPTVELIPTLGALFPRGGPVHDPVLTPTEGGTAPLIDVGERSDAQATEATPAGSQAAPLVINPEP